MVESYNILIMMQFEGYFATENAKEKEYNQRLAELEIVEKSVNEAK